jgi:hypothetical protein
MRIELLEDDSLANGGKAKNIVVSIDGNRMILPIRTKLSELVEMVKKANLIPIPVKEENVPVIAPEAIKQALLEGSIEKEDIVRCIHVMERAQGADVDIRVGGEYRVLGIKKISVNGQTLPEHYDIIDDNAPIPRRVMVWPSEIMLLRKHVPGPKKVLVFEERTICGFCGEDNALILDKSKNKYCGVCTKCHKEIEIERPFKANS